MGALLVTVVIASLLGSPHCAGMCGPLTLLVAGERHAGTAWRQVAWHAGRLVGYVTLGAVAGGVGAAIDLGGGWLGLQRVALIVSGGGLVAVGIGLLLVRVGWLRRAAARPTVLTRAWSLVARSLRHAPTVRRTAGFGAASILLPCGWLYAMVLTAAACGSMPLGAAVMAAFWLGSVPILAAIGVGAGLIEPLRRRAPWLAEGVLVAVGALLLADRLSIAPPRRLVDPAGLEGLARQVEALDPQAVPCCHDGN